MQLVQVDLCISQGFFVVWTLSEQIAVWIEYS
jgi:hypothetical protein